MSVRATESPFRTIRRLWKRAPIWRLLFLTAALLTLLCVLFPPRGPAVPRATVPMPAAATYTPPPPAPVTASAAAQAAVSPPAPPAAAPAHAAAPPVQTAKLSLATPEESRKADGLNDALAGHRFSGSLRVDSFNVPLPPGEWIELAGMHVDQKSPQGDKTASGELLMLGRVKDRRLAGFIRITAVRSTTDPGAGFGVSPGCDKQNENTNVLVREAIEPSGHEACWLIDHFFLTPLRAWADRSNKLPVLERAAFGDLAAKGVTYPSEMLNVRFTRAERWGLLEVRYVFSPEEDHIAVDPEVATYMDSDWQPGTIDRYPEKVAYVAKLKQWGDDFWPRFKGAFDAGQPTPSH